MAQNLSNLPIGAKIKFGKHSVNGEVAQEITWLIVAKNHGINPSYPANSVTLLAEKIIDLRAMDANESVSPNNTYSLSNLDQWLNKDTPAWFEKTHTSDYPPDNDYVTSGTGYSNRPGFLSNFTLAERNAILSTTFRTLKYQNSYEETTRKVFLPSLTEVGVTPTGLSDGTALPYFTTASLRRAMLTKQCYDNTLSSSKPTAVSNYWSWWVRSASYGYSNRGIVIKTDGSYDNYVLSSQGEHGVRPMLNLSSTLAISDTTDSDGCYNTLFNTAPPVPTTLNVPTIYGGKSSTISWSKVTDPDGHTVTYQLEQSLNGGTYTTLYSGANLSFTTVVPTGSTSVQFRLKAIDSLGASSGYIESTSRTVIDNKAPGISGTNGNIGTKSSEFTQSYTITDANGDTVTVTEAIDGVQIRSYVATLNASNGFSVTGNTWLSLSNGTHTMTITATDGIDSSVRTFTFTKSVSSFTIQSTAPMMASARPTRIKLNVNRTMPPEATLKVEVCNNGYDASPTWEDATASVSGGLVHLFLNTTKTTTNWGVLIRVTVNRNGGSGACYVSSIGGNFE